MQVFNAFFIILKSKLGITLIYIVLFAALALAMTLTDNTSVIFEPESLNICIFDEDGTPESRALTEMLGKRNETVTLENDRDTLIDALYYGRVDYVLTIKSGYAEKLISGDTEGLFESLHIRDDYSTVYAGQMLTEYAGLVAAYSAGGNDTMTAIEKAETAMLKEADVTVARFNENGGVFSPNTSFYFRFLVYALIGLTMSTLCPVLLAMNKKDVRYRTVCSGILPRSYTSQIFMGCVIYIFLIWLVYMAAGIFMNGGMYEGMQWLGVLNSFVFTIFSAALTVFVTSFDPSINIINIITQVISLGMCFTGGVFIEQSLLGESVLAAARFMPVYWYIRVNRMLEGAEPFNAETAYLALAIELGFAAVMAILTVLVRRARYTGKAAAAI